MPDRFWSELSRVFRIPISAETTKRSPAFARLVAVLVYEKVPGDLLPEVRKRNPIEPSGSRPRRHHQHLWEEGRQVVRDQIAGVVKLEASSSRGHFKLLFEATSKRQLPLELVESLQA